MIWIRTGKAIQSLFRVSICLRFLWRVRISEPPTWESKRQVYIPVYRRPGANTIEVVDGIKARIPEFKSRLPGKGPEELNLKVVADQSVYVRENINALLREAGLGAVLASLMSCSSSAVSDRPW
jgi:hypothetical protein